MIKIENIRGKLIIVGCDVGCPYIGRNFDDNWGLPDPIGCSDDEFMEVISEIERKILRMKERFES